MTKKLTSSRQSKRSIRVISVCDLNVRLFALLGICHACHNAELTKKVNKKYKKNQ